ncbi:MAG: thiol-disulfide isomerase/thioredoxin [Saprospiraceae bacterium]|jgi:thiol-disulfide isomerase/thioredoxin
MKRILLSAVMAFLFVGSAFAQTTYYSEDFEAGLPADWSVEGEWVHGDEASLSSAYLSFAGNATNFMAFNDDGLGSGHVGDGTMYTGNIDLTAVTGSLFMEVNMYFLNADYGGADETVKLFASYDDGLNWEEVKDFSAVAWDFELLSVDQFAGKMVKLAFEYTDGAAWNYGVAVDDISISDIPVNSTRRSYVMTVNGGTQFDNCGQNIDYPVEGAFVNNGYEPVTSFDITVINDGVSTTTGFDGFTLEKGEGIRYTMEEKVNTGEDNFDISVSVSNVNGEMEEDEETADNFAVIAFAPVETHPNKAVVIEEATGTWCTWCPRGTVYMDEMAKRFGDNFVAIAVHNGGNDPMTLSAYDNEITSFPNFTGFPSVIYNRTNILDPGDIVTPSISDMKDAPEVTVEVGAEANGGSLGSNVRVRLADANSSANYNVSVVLTEDNLTGVEGPGAQWGQINAYSGGGQGPMGGFEYFGSSVASQIWPYSHVGRALIGGYDGINGVTGNFGAGESIIVEMGDFDMNADWNMDNMHIIAIVTNSSGQVVNAISSKLNDAIANGLLSPGTATTEIYDTNLASVYPNPASDFTNIKINVGSAADVTIQVTDMMGQLVSKRNLGTVAGTQNVGYDVSELAAGNYTFKIIAGDKVATQKVSVIK